MLSTKADHFPMENFYAMQIKVISYRLADWSLNDTWPEVVG